MAGDLPRYVPNLFPRSPDVRSIQFSFDNPGFLVHYPSPFGNVPSSFGR